MRPWNLLMSWDLCFSMDKWGKNSPNKSHKIIHPVSSVFWTFNSDCKASVIYVNKKDFPEPLINALLIVQNITYKISFLTSSVRWEFHFQIVTKYFKVTEYRGRRPNRQSMLLFSLQTVDCTHLVKYHRAITHRIAKNAFDVSKYFIILLCQNNLLISQLTRTPKTTVA